MITIGNNKYIESQNIRVFPCAYRGYYDSTNSKVFDPEARATTEANFTNTFHKLSDNKDSYIVAWVPDTGKQTYTLKCVIGGYYFEIYNQTMSDFFYSESMEDHPYYLCIKTESIALGTSMTDDVDARTTTVLSSFEESTNYLDVYKETDSKYAFTGLLISKTATGTASLAPFRVVDSGGGGYNWEINAAKFPITNLLDVGSGNYSLRMVEDDTASGANTTIASGNYSVALGLKTIAEGEASTALGNNTRASARGAFAAGNTTTASGEGTAALGGNTTASGTNAVALGDATTASGTNSVALGSNTRAGADNQVVIGAYNEKDDNQAFIIANGTDDSLRSNKFTVSYEGNVKALGTLETKGSIKATDNSNNTLELGTSIAGSSGSIKVYGAGAAPVFQVENTGNTTIAGTTNIAGATNIAGNTEITGATTITNETESNSISTGALKVAGGAGVTKNLNVGGELSVAANKATTLGGSLTTKGNTTLEGTLTTTLSTTLKDTLNVEKLATLKAGAEIIGNTKITGNAEVTENIKITGKVTSAATNEGDSPNTLTTKDYVDKLQATILGAIYPIGSIYMQYVAPDESEPTECPLAATLTKSDWELIEGGRFLRSVEAADDQGKKGGSADAVLINHTHTYTGDEDANKITANTGYGGAHDHSVTYYASSVGTGEITGFDGNGGKDTFEMTMTTTQAGAHDHTLNITLPDIGNVSQTENITVSDNGTGRNLPPYLNVYMWRRTS